MIKKPWVFYLSLFSVVLIFSLFLFTTGVLFAAIGVIQTVPLLAEFVAGFFYSSFITSALAVFMISILSQTHPTLQIALIGGFGSMLADLVLFKFARLIFFGSFSPLTLNLRFSKTIKALHQNPAFNLIAPILGGLIIASPLPDEVGIAIFGLTRLPTLAVALLTYSLNTIGIFILAHIAQQIV